MDVLLLALLRLTIVLTATMTAAWPGDPPHYPHYPGRRLQVLNGTWAFAFVPNGTSSFDVEHPDLSAVNFNESMAVPGCFDLESGPRPHVRGTGIHRAVAGVQPHTPLLLHFGACSLWCAVYADGRLLKSFADGGFTPFWVGPFEANSTSVEITVIADNRFDENRTVTQRSSYGFYQYGGILRAATLHEFDERATTTLYLQRVESHIVNAVDGLLNISAFLGCLKPSSKQTRPLPLTVGLGISWGGDSVVTWHQAVAVNLATGEVQLGTIQVPPTKRWLWTPNSPRLQTLTVHLRTNSSADSIRIRVGLRSISVSSFVGGSGESVTPAPAPAPAAAVLLNGVPIKLLGFNRHEMHPAHGR